MLGQRLLAAGGGSLRPAALLSLLVTGGRPLLLRLLAQLLPLTLRLGQQLVRLVPGAQDDRARLLLDIGHRERRGLGGGRGVGFDESHEGSQLSVASCQLLPALCPLSNN